MVFRLPSDVKKIFHPIICCALSADVAALAYGHLSQLGLNSVLGKDVAYIHGLYLLP